MNIVRRMPGYGDATSLCRMFELTMTARGGDKKPTVISEQLENITNLHGSHMIGKSTQNQKS